MMGSIAANSMAGALAPYPAMAGAASALAGTVQFTFGAITGWAVGRLADGTPVPVTEVIFAMGSAVQL